MLHNIGLIYLKKMVLQRHLFVFSVNGSKLSAHGTTASESAGMARGREHGGAYLCDPSLRLLHVRAATR